MSLQQTVRREIEYTGIEFFGGNEVTVRIKPAEEDRGILFQTRYGDVPATLDCAMPSRCAILLSNGRGGVLHVEHFLATLWAYGVDNALVNLQRKPTRNFSLLERFHFATDIDVVPVASDRELTLCRKLEEAGLEAQQKERGLVTLKEIIYTDNGGRELLFEPTAKEGLHISALTNYAPVGEQQFGCAITPENYRDELARSRMCAKYLPFWVPRFIGHIGASLAYPHFGIGHGFSQETCFFPPKNSSEWYAQEIFPAELARHSIVDRLGALALLPGRLDHVAVATKYSGHANDLAVLKNEVIPRLREV